MTGSTARSDLLDEVERHWAALLDGRLTRDEVDRWAARWHTDDRAAPEPLAVWALDLLHGVDLPDLDGGFLFADEQVADWFAEFRRLRAEAPPGLAAIGERLVDLVEGRAERDAVAHWARYWCDHSARPFTEAERRLLQVLTQAQEHSDEQFREWLAGTRR
ncbi:hypothetical protein V5P93_006629 [Actinokineospora auranticolor]|uniref:Uncharacterized protein n=1 Tax=Actinokineospora auranticolor TaxID=155976 RepID=A0A2S6GWZ0_9PSEU|nr:hypothetical protein [Actinokineospora auranticolor]PPK69729.1 hypothetical protein CLV40_103339 [Actinokineospora auranticolor]